MRLVIEHISDRAADWLLRRSRALGKSPERVVEEMLDREAGETARPPEDDGSFRAICGIWGPDEALDRAVEEQRRVRPEDWA